jgi:uncharacterized membrane protein YdjX (TVP38/TMEM64 family)
MKLKTSALIIFVICLLATGLMFWWLGGIDIVALQIWLRQWGWWAPIAYVILYVIATVLVLPSTALNLTGGALFGPWWGLLWTSVAAILAAIVTFWFSRTIGRDTIAKRLAGKWQAMDAEVQRGGGFYMFAMRLLPLMPYGIVNFAAGLTSIRFKDYLAGTALGTVPGILPFVWLGSSGLRAVRTGDVWPLLAALSLIALLVLGSTWYRQRHQPATSRSKE